MSNKMEYFSIGNTVDGTNFCSGVETLAENLIEDNESEATITFPSKDGWASLRSTSYRMTTENAEAVLPLPIYKIKKVLIKPDGLKIITPQKSTTPGGTWVNEVGVSYQRYKNEKGEELEYFDITSYIKTAKEWKALPLASSRSDYLKNERKDNTFYWEDGASTIPFLGTSFTIPDDWIVTALGLEEKSPVWERLIRKVLYGYQETHFFSYEFEGETIRVALNPERDNFLHTDLDDGGGDVRSWLFRIEYVPLTSATKIRARKQAKTNVDFIQPFNQRAEINAVSAFGKSMYLTAQKTGVREIVVVKNYTDLSSVPPLGALVKHNGKQYRLIANGYTMTNTVYVQVKHTLSENWSCKSKHVSVDQKFRNWKIPQEILWRNLYWEEYVTVCDAEKGEETEDACFRYVKDAFFQWNKDETYQDYELKHLFFYKGNIIDQKTFYGAVLPLSTYSIGKSLVFSASMQDNLSAGLGRCWSKTADGVRYSSLCEEVFYCNEDGGLGTATIVLSKGVAVKTHSLYPNSIVEEGGVHANIPTDMSFMGVFDIKKDPSEALKITVQLHFVSNETWIVIGEKFAQKNPLITSEREELTLKYYDYEIPDGMEVLKGGKEARGKGFLFFLENDRLRLSRETLTDVTGYKSWALVNANDELYIGCNDIEKVTLQFNFKKKR